ncbi:thioredoxin domain-containing protein [Salinibacterium sp. NSLL150]|nr:thioredoxin domain-containing protein [Salinibacterium sp. NSLL35]MBH0101167.1 thioredoxin domain-containing protein [Salinibacterium sp. NSLL150]MBH0103926.1 thioredoxin domain-containing protein [Salinibacterium sp. NSLL16]MBH0106687.1 thioredoxin domain-containing protein [Salinibacterium sp. NSLL17]MBH0109542.1 thioredoxin domain-containing protein [Salinibacterium sp. NG22]
MRRHFWAPHTAIYTADEVRLSNGNPGDSRLSKNERREAAREKARIQRDEQKKKDRRTKWILQGSVGLALVAIVAVIALVLVNSNQPAGPGPQNFASDGIQLNQGFIATTSDAQAADAEPIANDRDEESGVLDIQMYVDYLCPICGSFEQTNGAYIESLVANGAATLEVHPITILDRLSQGQRYSSRAVNAVACVADTSPNDFYAYHSLLLTEEVQPEENTSGLSNEELIELLDVAGVESTDAIAECITDESFKSWVSNSTARALSDPIPNSDVGAVTGTPTVLVNGIKYEGAVNDLVSFQAFVTQAAGDDFIESSTPTPTPTPTP